VYSESSLIQIKLLHLKKPLNSDTDKEIKKTLKTIATREEWTIVKY
jgi:hypothetical protein